VLRRDQILLIEVEDHPELTGRYLVQDDGPRTLPAAGSISVGKEPEFSVCSLLPCQRATGGTPR